MRLLAVVAVLILSLTSAAAAEKAAASGVPFSVFMITNNQGIPMKVTLEAPAGKVIYGPTEVPASGSVSIDPKVKNVSTARITTDYGKDHGTQSQTVTLNGERNQLYIKTLMASGSIGDLRVTEIAGSNPE
jgi:hypothetical protein